MGRKRFSAIITAAAVVTGLVAGAPAQAAEPDTTPPTVTITSPAVDPPTVVQVDAQLIADFACTDPDVDGADTSGVEYCVGMITRMPDPEDPNPPVVQPVQVDPGQPIDTSQPGQYQLQVTGTDIANNSGSATSSFTIVGQEPQDTTEPTVEITAPVEGAQVKKGLSLIASYSCSDTESGLESCEGPVPSGEAIDTSSVGEKEFTVTARDAAGNEATKTVHYEVIPPASVTISGTIKDTSGNLVPGSTVQAMLTGTSEVVASTEANTEGVYSLTVPEGTYDLRYRGPEGSGIGANLENRDLSQDREINVTLGQVGIMLSGVLGDGFGVLTHGTVYVYQANWAQVAWLQVPEDGRWSVEVVPGDYIIQAVGGGDSRTFSHVLALRSYTSDADIDLVPQAVPVTVNLLGADGQPAAGRAKLECTVNGQETTYTNATASGTGTISVPGVPTLPGQTCALTVDPDDGPIITRNIEIPDTGTAVDLTVEPGITLSGVLGDGFGVLTHGTVYVYQANWAQVAWLQVPEDGRWSVEVVPGDYIIQAVGGGDSRTFSHVLALRSYTSDADIDLVPQAVPVTVNLLGADGQPTAGRAKLECTVNGQETTYTNATASGTGTISVPGVPTLPGQTCALTVDPDDAPIITRNIEIPDTGTAVDLTVEPGITLSGVLGDGFGVLTHGTVYVYQANWAQVAWLQVPEDGRWSVEVVPGDYIIQAVGGGDSRTFSHVLALRSYTSDADIDLVPQAVPVTVNLLGADGQPTAGRAKLECTVNGQETTYTNATASGTGTISVPGVPTLPGQTCALTVDPDDGPIITRNIEIPDTGAQLTIFTFGAGIVIDGGTTDTSDGDNVADAVEALAPNSGDGNNDGTPDYDQPHVTSLPVNGGSFGSGEHYVTVAAPEGTELTNVYTIDPTDTDKVEVPPPPGVTLPEGLTNLVLTGVEAGTDQTISVFTASTQNVTGYAKYNPNTKEWSLLPAERVQIFDNRVEITLTDGGIGDDDGAADGNISDPGGIAIVENLDTVAPTVTGQAKTQPNADGWYNDDVTVEWTATDPEPSSGLAGQPENTVVTGEGSDLAAQSGQVCDNTGNCSTGTVEGIKIDRMKPEIDVTGVADGQTYTLGAVPAAGCSASDALSGVDGNCTGTLTGGNANGVGEFTFQATAKDKAGNERVKTVTYRVDYRFDGFLPPINDPVFTNWDFKSVFRSGWPVPALFQLKKADGSSVQPGSAPEWLTPQKGKAINAPVNEEQPEEPPSSGKTFTKILGVWTYVWNTKGVEKGYEYRIGVKLDDGTKHYVTVAAK